MVRNVISPHDFAVCGIVNSTFDRVGDRLLHPPANAVGVLLGYQAKPLFSLIHGAPCVNLLPSRIGGVALLRLR